MSQEAGKFCRILKGTEWPRNRRRPPQVRGGRFGVQTSCLASAPTAVEASLCVEASGSAVEAASGGGRKPMLPMHFAAAISEVAAETIRPYVAPVNRPDAVAGIVE